MESPPTLVPILQSSQEQAKNASIFLKNQWPAVSIGLYSKSIIASTVSAFPRHFLLKTQEGEIVGHVKVQKCYQRRAEGVAALVTSLLVSAQQRGKGLGRRLMKAVQEYVKSQNIPQGIFMVRVVALSTKDQLPFYQKLGYKRSLPLSKKSKLDSKSVAHLEAHFAKKANILHHSPDDVWLSKRVIEVFPFQQIPILDTNGKAIKLEHQLQIGPNCGIVALRMIQRLRETHPSQISFSSADIGTCDICAAKQEESKAATTDIEYLRERGASYDGEIFCIRVLQDLATNFFNLNSRLCKIFELEKELVGIIDGGRVVLIPFDVDDNGEAAFKGGNAAHWGIIIGYTLDSQCILVHSKIRAAFKIALSQLIESNMQLHGYSKEEVGDLYRIPDQLVHLRGFYLIL